MGEFTPGPWIVSTPPVKADPYQAEDRLIFAGGDTRPARQHIAEVFQYRNDSNNQADGVALANARLIAQAPELAAVVAEFLAIHTANCASPEEFRQRLEAARLKAEAALRALEPEAEVRRG